MREHDRHISTQLDAHSDVLIKQSSTILGFVSTTPDAVAEIRSAMTAQAEQHSQHAKSLLNVLSDTSVTLAAIGKHASHIKRTIARLCHFIQDIQKILILYCPLVTPIVFRISY